MRISQHLQLFLLLILPVHAAVVKVLASYNSLAAFYDSASAGSSEEKRPSTHSDAVMAEERRLAEERRKAEIQRLVDLAANMHPIYTDDDSMVEQTTEQDIPDLETRPKQQLKKRAASEHRWRPHSSIVPEYGQCGGRAYLGPRECDFGTYCRRKDEYYSQCVSLPTPPGYVERYGQCGGENYFGNRSCRPDTFCTYQNRYYSQCL